MRRVACAALLWLGVGVTAAGAAATLDSAIQSTSFVTSDGVRLHVLEAGPPVPDPAAPVLAFIPGWSMPAEIWRAQLSALAARHRVAALDPRGQGESEIAANGYNIERRAADIAEFVVRYPRVVLVGWSLGALESLHYLHLRGDSGIAALVLVDSSVGEEPVPPPGKSFIEALKQDREAALDAFVRGIFSTPRPEPEIMRLKDGAMRMPLDASLSLFPAGTPRAHWRVIARGFRKPLLYAVTSAFAEQAQNLQSNRPATQVAVFEDAGHALFVDEPDRFNQLLVEFAAQVKAGAGRK
jgi:microsomal epoxide hydrolase